MFHRFGANWRILLICSVLFPAAAVLAQSLRGSSLDSRGFTVDFGAESAGQSVTVMALGLGRLGHRTIAGDGRLRVDLAGVPPPAQGHACFFMVRDADGQLVSLSARRGFYDPFWEDAAANGGAPPRDEATILAERDAFEAEAVAAHRWLDRDQGRIYAGGACRPTSHRVSTRPHFAFDPPMSRIYAVQRCAAVFAAPRLTCAAAREIAGSGGDRALAMPDCDARLADTATAINAVARDDAAVQDAAVARDYARRAAAAPDTRGALAGACVAAVAGGAEQRLAAWRVAQGADETDRQIGDCQRAATFVADEDDRRAALAAELARAAAAPHVAGGRVPTDTRSYPCALP